MPTQRSALAAGEHPVSRQRRISALESRNLNEPIRAPFVGFVPQPLRS